jgi:hypothetical protein
MATVLEKCTTKEQRPVVRFLLWAKGLATKDIRKELFLVYGEKFLLRKLVHNWVEKFCQGRSKVADVARPGVEIVTEASVQRVEELIRADRRITIDSVATALGCSHGLAYSVMHGRLQCRKLCLRWMPRAHLLRYTKGGEDMLNRVFTGDKSWVHHYQPKTKCALMQWKFPSSPSPKKFKVTPSYGKLCLPCFGILREYC